MENVNIHKYLPTNYILLLLYKHYMCTSTNCVHNDINAIIQLLHVLYYKS